MWISESLVRHHTTLFLISWILTAINFIHIRSHSSLGLDYKSMKDFLKLSSRIKRNFGRYIFETSHAFSAIGLKNGRGDNQSPHPQNGSQNYLTSISSYWGLEAENIRSLSVKAIFCLLFPSFLKKISVFCAYEVKCFAFESRTSPPFFQREKTALPINSHY